MLLLCTIHAFSPNLHIKQPQLLTTRVYRSSMHHLISDSEDHLSEYLHTITLRHAHSPWFEGVLDTSLKISHLLDMAMVRHSFPTLGRF